MVRAFGVRGAESEAVSPFHSPIGCRVRGFGTPRGGTLRVPPRRQREGEGGGRPPLPGAVSLLLGRSAKGGWDDGSGMKSINPVLRTGNRALLTDQESRDGHQFIKI